MELTTAQQNKLTPAILAHFQAAFCAVYFLNFKLEPAPLSSDLPIQIVIKQLLSFFERKIAQETTKEIISSTLSILATKSNPKMA